MRIPFVLDSDDGEVRCGAHLFRIKDAARALSHNIFVRAGDRPKRSEPADRDIPERSLIAGDVSLTAASHGREQRTQSRIFQKESLRLILPSVNSNRSHPRTSMCSPVNWVPRIVHSDTPRSPHVQWRSSSYLTSGIPSNLDWIPSRTCCLPVSRRPPGAGPRGMSRTQSSVKNDITSSTSWALNASSNACRDGVATLEPAMELASSSGGPSLAHRPAHAQPFRLLARFRRRGRDSNPRTRFPRLLA